MRAIPQAPPTSADLDGRTRVLSRNLVALGLTSFFADISSEMVIAVVPLFLTTSLGFSIVGFGLFEGAYQATNAVFRIWGGSVADHRQHHKRTATTGYSISAATRVGLVVSALVAWVPVIPFLLADRIGKGLRTAPRDALISLSTAPARLATAFGVHRAMDTAGALLGPLIAFAVLAQAEGAFDAVFVISAIAAVIGVAVIWLFAEERPQRAATATRPRIRDQWRRVLSVAPARALVAGASLVSLCTIGDAFVYLVIQRTTDMGARYFPLLFVGTAVVYLAFAVPVGRLADRVGPKTVFLGGNLLLVVLYGVLAFSTLGPLVVFTCLGLLGLYYAATDGVVAAMTARLVPAEVRATGIALVTVAIAVARMIAAATFGTIWHLLGSTTALLAFALAMLVGVAVARQLLGEAEHV